MNDKRYSKRWLWSFGGSAILFIAMIIGITIFFGYNAKNDVRGTFGDMFGMANAIFTGLSFVGLIITILLQSQEIRNTNEEVEKQGYRIKLQQFENVFFQRLALLNQLIDDIETTNSSQPENQPVIKTVYRGRTALSDLHNIIVIEMQDNSKNFDYAYRTFYQANYMFTHYFRSLYLLVKSIDDEKFQNEENVNFITQKKYVDIIRGQLSEHELAIMFYSSLHNLGIKEFKQLIEKYSLFLYINNEYILEEMRSLYSDSAFIENKIIL